jgi:uncharacterized membrane protein
MPASISQYVPQYASSETGREMRRKAFVAWGAVAAGALALVALAFSAPLALAGGHASLARAVYGGFHVGCHQIAERSFYLAGYPLAVCARCTGLYAGFALGVLVYPLVRRVERRDTPARVWLILSALPLAFDFALGVSGIWENTHASRLLTGALLGAVAVFYVLPGVSDLMRLGWRGLFQSQTLSNIGGSAR